MGQTIQVKNTGGGISFAGALGLLFIGLKLADVITWSWLLVLLPLYGPAILVLIVFIIVVASA